MPRPVAIDLLRPELEKALKKRVGQHRSPLYDMLRYHMGWVDEMRAPHLTSVSDRVHGVLCLTVAKTTGASLEQAMPAGVAIELAEGFMTLHEDLRLGNPNRGTRPALWWVWGHSQGINAGDGMYALARLALMDLSAHGSPPERALRATSLLDEACLSACECRFLEIELSEKGSLNTQEYLRIAEGESGALMGAAAGMGAIAGGAGEPSVEAFHQFGRRVGVAYRIKEDLETLWGVDSRVNATQVLEALDRRRSLPVLHALEHLPPAERKALDALTARDEPVDDRRLESTTQMLEAAGSRAFAESTLEKYVTRGLEALSTVGIAPEGRQELEQLMRYVTTPCR